MLETTFWRQSNSPSDQSPDISITDDGACVYEVTHRASKVRAKHRNSSSRISPNASKEAESFWIKPFILFSKSKGLAFLLCVAGLASVSVTALVSRNIDCNTTSKTLPERILQDSMNIAHRPAAGLRGDLLQKASHHRRRAKQEQHEERIHKKVEDKHHHQHTSHKEDTNKFVYTPHTNEQLSQTRSKRVKQAVALKVTPPKHLNAKSRFDSQDRHMYISSSAHNRKNARVISLDPSMKLSSHHMVQTYPADYTDNTQLYSILDSNDERVKTTMEIREPHVQGECVPMKDWQTTFYPSCNSIHELGLENVGEENDNQFYLFGTKGYWRNAWRVDVTHVQNRSLASDTIVLKTLKIHHRFEEAHFEHDRIDAVAMERLTSSPHVINIFGFCGHSVLTEYADGPRLGELADKVRKTPLARLRIARDIANGLADVHGIDGDGVASFVHLDVNPANVVSVGGTLKLNDFNIGIIRRLNTTSNTPCGFPAQYPNPQWRSPEEAREEQNLTEKVDIFSLGHIFFRLICGHEPWNKLEPGGKPSKAEVNDKVKRGVLPTIPSSVLTDNDPEVVAIRDAMSRCYMFDPSKRPSAKEIAIQLRRSLDQLESTI